MGELKLKNNLPIHFEADSLQFGLYSKEEILKLSVVEVINPASFNHLGHPLESGLYDLKMGPFSGRNLCLNIIRTIFLDLIAILIFFILGLPKNRII